MELDPQVKDLLEAALRCWAAPAIAATCDHGSLLSPLAPELVQQLFDDASSLELPELNRALGMASQMWRRVVMAGGVDANATMDALAELSYTANYLDEGDLAAAATRLMYAVMELRVLVPPGQRDVPFIFALDRFPVADDDELAVAAVEALAAGELFATA